MGLASRHNERMQLTGNRPVSLVLKSTSSSGGFLELILSVGQQTDRWLGGLLSVAGSGLILWGKDSGVIGR